MKKLLIAALIFTAPYISFAKGMGKETDCTHASSVSLNAQTNPDCTNNSNDDWCNSKKQPQSDSTKIQ